MPPWCWWTAWPASKCRPKRSGSFADDFKLPRAVVINKLDRERADFERALESVQENFGRAAVPIQIPIGAERDFTGVVDLVRMKAYTYAADGDGKGKEGEIPADLADAAQKAHEALVEMVAEGNDALMEEFFDKGTLAPEQIVDGLKQAIREMRIFPVLCASALHNIGTDLILNFIVENLPAPTEREAVAATVERRRKPRRRSPRAAPPPLFVFKTTADPFAGRITYFKVITGVVKNDANLQNVTRSAAERLAHIGSPMGKTLQPVTELHAGDIGAVAKLKDTLTGDTLADKGFTVTYPPVKLPEPSIAFAIEAKSRNDEDRMGNAVHRILEEDQSLRFYRDPQTTRVPAGRHRPAARRNRGQPAEEALRRGCHPEGAQDSLPRDHPRHGRRAGPPQEADRRPRPVRRLLDQDGAAAARRQVRVRQRDLRRLHPQELHPGGGKGHHRSRRKRLPGRLSRWWISR